MGLSASVSAKQFQVMMQLGSSEAGAEVRARMQSASLLSDMESFKAASVLHEVPRHAAGFASTHVQRPNSIDV